MVSCCSREVVHMTLEIQSRGGITDNWYGNDSQPWQCIPVTILAYQILASSWLSHLFSFHIIVFSLSLSTSRSLLTFCLPLLANWPNRWNEWITKTNLGLVPFCTYCKLLSTPNYGLLTSLKFQWKLSRNCIPPLSTWLRKCHLK